jgi:NAD(P)H-hydrate epimerase
MDHMLPDRPKDAHKGLFGHVLVVGGDYGMPGAVRLAAEGALRVGAGLVTVATRKAHVYATVCGRPELLCYGIETSTTQLKRLINKASIIVLGPGLGQSTWSKRLLHCVLASEKPVLIDADGLNLLARHAPKARDHWILTPHPGEAARLLQQSISWVQANRIEAASQLQTQWGGVVVLKGAHTLIASAQVVQTCTAGNPGMASGGMGDLLSGIIAGLVAQHMSLPQAALAGVTLHANAGDRVASLHGERGMLASDLLNELPFLVNQ